MCQKFLNHRDRCSFCLPLRSRRALRKTNKRGLASGFALRASDFAFSYDGTRRPDKPPEKLKPKNIPLFSAPTDITPACFAISAVKKAKIQRRDRCFWLFLAKYPSVLQDPNWRPEYLCRFDIETISVDHLQGHLLFHYQVPRGGGKKSPL